MITENQNSDISQSSQDAKIGLREYLDRLSRRHLTINAYTYDPKPEPASIPEKNKTFLVRFFSWIFEPLSQVTTKYLDSFLQFFKVNGHYKYANIILFFLLYFIFAGPSSNFPVVGLAALVILSVTLTIIVSKLESPWKVLWLWHWLVAGISCLAVFLVDHFTLFEKSLAHYAHFYILLVAIVLLIQLLTSTLSILLLKKGFKRLREQINGRLPLIKMFYKDEEKSIEPIGRWDVIRNALLGLVYQPIKVLLFPAIVILISPVLDQPHARLDWTPVWLDRAHAWMGVTLLFTLGYVAIFSSHQRFKLLLEVLDGLFFKGGPLVLSLLIIVLGGLHLFGVSYVSTLVESNPGRWNGTLLSYLVSVYVLFWFYEYWINRALLEYFVGLFHESAGRDHPGKIVNMLNNADECLVLQAHGSSQLLLYKHEAGEKQYDLFTRRGFLDRLERKLEQLDTFSDTQKKHLKEDVYEFKQAMRFYFLIVNLLFLAMVVILLWINNHRPQLAALTVRAEIPQEEVEQLFDLREQIFNKKETNNSEEANDKLEPVILLAGSGGGTRAAMYTQSVMRGLHEHKYLKNVLLTSTVSGGGAAVGYFSMHRDRLLKTPVCQEYVTPGSSCSPELVSSVWKDFSRTMTKPYILDVLKNAVDLRLALGVDSADYHAYIDNYKARFRFANLLSESMGYRLPGDLKQENLVRSLGDQQNIGLIFNTTVMARFPRWSCDNIDNEDWKACLCGANGEKKPPLAVSEADCKNDLRTSVDEGGRLVLTNLNDLGGFPQADPSIPDKEFDNDYLHYVGINDPQVAITKAVALSANFPVVFPNSAVDIDNLRRYWITDGGIADNRGLLSLLYVLHEAVKQEMESQCNDYQCTLLDGTKQCSCLHCPPNKLLPPIHVVVADASAISLSAKKNISIGAAISRSPLFAGQIIRELEMQIKRDYECLGGEFYMHELPMPLVLRSGGLGTHWMLPSKVTFSRPRDITRQRPKENEKLEDDDKTRAELDREAVRTLVEQLHSTKNDAKDNMDQSKNDAKDNMDQKLVWQWIRQEKYANHPEAWNKLLQALGAKGKKTTGTGTAPISCDFEPITILFEFDSASLTPKVTKDLNLLAERLSRCTNVWLKVEGHTDWTGSESYNLALSCRRMAAVTQYLVSRDISRNRLIPVIFGESGPAATNTTPNGRKNNRRVVLTLMKLNTVRAGKIGSTKSDDDRPDGETGMCDF